MNPFSWIRNKVAQAVVSGVSDGLAAIAADGDDPPADVGELRARLAAAVQPKALPPAADDEPEPAARNGRKK